MKNFFKKQPPLFSVKKNRGFMMVEILVAVSIITVSILVVMWVAQKSVAVSRQALHASQASFLLEEGAEVVRILRDNGWVNIDSLDTSSTYYPVFASGTWGLSEDSSQTGIFSRTITIDDVNRDAVSGDIDPSGVLDPGARLITVTVSWSESGQTITKTLSFYIFDIFS